MDEFRGDIAAQSERSHIQQIEELREIGAGYGGELDHPSMLEIELRDGQVMDERVAADGWDKKKRINANYE
jgi:hypothetical protein